MRAEVEQLKSDEVDPVLYMGVNYSLLSNETLKAIEEKLKRQLQKNMLMAFGVGRILLSHTELGTFDELCASRQQFFDLTEKVLMELSCCILESAKRSAALCMQDDSLKVLGMTQLDFERYYISQSQVLDIEKFKEEKKIQTNEIEARKARLERQFGNVVAFNRNFKRAKKWKL